MLIKNLYHNNKRLNYIFRTSYVKSNKALSKYFFIMFLPAYINNFMASTFYYKKTALLDKAKRAVCSLFTKLRGSIICRPGIYMPHICPLRLFRS